MCKTYTIFVLGVLKKPVKLVGENKEITVGCEQPVSERKVPTERISLTQGNIGLLSNYYIT